MLYFEVSEYQERLRKTKEAMQQRGIEVLLVTDPANMNYLTGYDGWSFYVHQGVIVALNRQEPIWFGRQQDSNGARITTWLQDHNVRGYTDDYVQSQVKHPMSFAVDLLKEIGCDRKDLGVEMDNYYFTGRCLDQLRHDLPNDTIKNGDLIVNWVRSIKSAQEIDYLRMASRIAEKVMQTAVDSIDVGVREGDAAANVYHAQISGTAEFTGDYSAIIPIMPSALRTSTAHLSWVDRKYETGDVVLLELSGCKNRYHAPLSRTVYLGKPPAELDEIAKVVIHGLNRTLDFIKPGVTAEQVEETWRHAIAGSRVVKESRVGYAYGLNYPPDWGEHTISLRPGDRTVLRPGMTIHFMPGIWLDRFGFECSEPFLVTENGCETFVDFPRQLFVKE
ncbi:M24 family metallopeptidase [Desulfoferrobacter suflitae]|uniref:M24 family metallopeptidase n=1 Tax=Desulfoferrobacter suflitae TaxID=2865782 RepID=UPI002164925A|nr:M24 family metallopeptidase [Desulfoferrobacter suflitae]MCK8601435.1 M24 family metallopeptidase [Desulfoferrobacter suflitae]